MREVDEKKEKEVLNWLPQVTNKKHNILECKKKLSRSNIILNCILINDGSKWIHSVATKHTQRRDYD